MNTKQEVHSNEIDLILISEFEGNLNVLFSYLLSYWGNAKVKVYVQIKTAFTILKLCMLL